MRLHPDFLAAALAFLEASPTVGGVGGAIVDRQALNLEYTLRARRADPRPPAGRGNAVEWVRIISAHRYRERQLRHRPQSARR